MSPVSFFSRIILPFLTKHAHPRARKSFLHRASASSTYTSVTTLGEVLLEIFILVQQCIRDTDSRKNSNLIIVL